MKENLDQLIENYFTPKDEKLDTDVLLGLIAEALSTAGPARINEGKDALPADISDMLPTLKITEDWGKLNKKDREVIEKFTASLGGETTSVKEKLAQISAITSGQKEAVTIGEILTTMMMIEILSSILQEFTESAAGFIFEGFIAGLFGGKSIQITKPEDIPGMEATGKPITDVTLAGRHYSLKLLGPGTAVKGSFRNMVDHFRTVNHITYLDARRSGDDLIFSEFDITLLTFMDVFYMPFTKFAKKYFEVKMPHYLRKRLEALGDQVYQVKLARQISKKVSPAIGGRTVMKPEDFEELLSLENEMLAQLGPFVISYSEESFAKSKKAKQYFGNARIFNNVQVAIRSEDEAKIFAALEETPAYGPKIGEFAGHRPEQFNFTPSQVESIKSFRVIGRLELGDEALKKTWVNYGERLRETIAPVYQYLNSFTRNINSYFLSAPAEKGNSRSGYASNAISDASELRSSTDQAVTAIEKERSES